MYEYGITRTMTAEKVTAAYPTYQKLGVAETVQEAMALATAKAKEWHNAAPLVQWVDDFSDNYWVELVGQK